MNGAKGGTSLHYSKGTPESCADSKNPVVKHSEGRKQGRSPLSLSKFGGFFISAWIEISI
jgi:hypothetical protein